MLVIKMIMFLSLVMGLGLPHFQDREKCTKALSELNKENDFRFALKLVVDYHPVPEVANRADRIIEEYLMTRPSFPCLDLPKISSYNGYADKSWSNVFHKTISTESFYLHDFFLPQSKWVATESELRNATINLIYDWHKQGIPRKEIIKRLDVMVLLEVFGWEFYPEIEYMKSDER